MSWLQNATERNFMLEGNVRETESCFKIEIIMSSVMKICQRFMTSFPGGIQSVQTGLLMGSGDLIAQMLVERKPLQDINLSRTLKFSFIGVAFVGPALSTWYGFLHNFFGSSGKITALKKVSCDQFLVAPPFLALFMGIVGLSNGNNMKEIIEKIENDYPDILINNYKLWPAVQLINFYAVPLKYQVVTVQVVALLWNTYLSWKMNEGETARAGSKYYSSEQEGSEAILT